MKQPGEVIERRPIKRIRDSSQSQGESPRGVTSNLNIDELEYYIHFPSFDRRLDEWVSFDRIDIKSSLTGAADHDEGQRNKRQKRRVLPDAEGGGGAFQAPSVTDSKREEKEMLLAALEKGMVWYGFDRC